MSTGSFSWEASSLKKNTFQIVFRILDGDVSGFRQKFSSTVVRTSLDSRFLIGIMPTFFGLYAKFYRLVCGNCTLCVHRIVFMGSIFFEKKNTFQIVFRILDGDFSGFRQKFSSTVVRTSLDSRFLIGIMPTFFGLYAKFYRLVCRNCTLFVHRIVFMGSIFFEKKNTFQIVFRILDGDFSGFRQEFPSTVVRTSLDSRFLKGIMPTFFRTLRKILLAGLSELHSTCPQDCFHGKHLLWKKTLFHLYFTFWTETFQFFGKTFPAR